MDDPLDHLRKDDPPEGLHLRESQHIRRLTLPHRNTHDPGSEDLSEIRRVIDGESDQGGIDAPAGGEFDAEHIVGHEKDDDQLQHQGGAAQNGNAQLHKKVQRFEFAHPRERKQDPQRQGKQECEKEYEQRGSEAADDLLYD